MNRLLRGLALLLMLVALVVLTKPADADLGMALLALATLLLFVSFALNRRSRRPPGGDSLPGASDTDGREGDSGSDGAGD
ncbi:hypothetical protein [Ferrimonas sediminicola]|uniref:hypothetical protein n=1 Tax=Ferrimonas sediminicola TaxID=2569538 RepID=UPI00145D71D0|nr:hypothetical protein [Ferrimonas sediminicola]